MKRRRIYETPKDTISKEDCESCLIRSTACVFEVLFFHYPVEKVTFKRGWGCPIHWGLKSNKGSILIIVALLLPLLLAFGALALDVGYLSILKNEIQNVADASVLAGCRVIGIAYEGIQDCTERQNYFSDQVLVLNVCRDVALKNKVAGEPFILEDADIVIGRWDWSTRTLEPTLNRPYAVKVIARKKILTLFKREISIMADAIASLMVTNELIPCQDEPEPGKRKWSIPALVE